MQYEIVDRRPTYPLLSVITRYDPAYDDNGNAIMRDEAVLDGNGVPIIDEEPVMLAEDTPATYTQVVSGPDGSPLVDQAGMVITNEIPIIRKVMRMQKVQARAPVWETRENVNAEPDGLEFNVIAWSDDSDKQHGTTLKFHIGRAAFEGLDAANKKDIIKREVEALFINTVSPAEAAPTPRSAWMDDI